MMVPQILQSASYGDMPSPTPISPMLPLATQPSWPSARAIIVLKSILVLVYIRGSFDK